jgi:hypothetical protein
MPCKPLVGRRLPSRHICMCRKVYNKHNFRPSRLPDGSTAIFGLGYSGSLNWTIPQRNPADIQLFGWQGRGRTTSTQHDMTTDMPNAQAANCLHSKRPCQNAAKKYGTVALVVVTPPKPRGAGLRPSTSPAATRPTSEQSTFTPTSLPPWMST